MKATYKVWIEVEKLYPDETQYKHEAAVCEPLDIHIGSGQRDAIRLQVVLAQIGEIIRNHYEKNHPIRRDHSLHYGPEEPDAGHAPSSDSVCEDDPSKPR